MPQPNERVLLNPATGKPLRRPSLYRRVLALGKRAGVPDAHPHRYRDTFAVDLLVRGATLYEVAQLLGDTVAMVEKHYLSFVEELQKRARDLMENGEGLEKITSTILTQSPAKTERVQ